MRGLTFKKLRRSWHALEYRRLVQQNVRGDADRPVRTDAGFPMINRGPETIHCHHEYMIVSRSAIKPTTLPILGKNSAAKFFTSSFRAASPTTPCSIRVFQRTVRTCTTLSSKSHWRQFRLVERRIGIQLWKYASATKAP